MNCAVSRAPRILTLLAAAILLLCGTLLFPALLKATGNPTPDARAGQILFEKRCSGCHGLDTAKEGPPLRTVYGRKAGSVSGFEYSDTLKQSGFVWDDARLNQWLTDTESLVRDNNMEFAVPRADERAQIIQFLKESSGK